MYMNYVSEMLKREEEGRRKLDELLNDESLQKLVLRAGKHVSRDVILGLRGTKAINLEDMSNTDEEYDNRESWGELLLSAHDRPMTGVAVTTWSSLVRNALDLMRPQINDVLSKFGSEQFREVYEICLNRLFTEDSMIKANSNFVKRLYTDTEETDLIRSTVYLSNKNHMLEIFTDENGVKWYACAVYTGEIIWVLEALLDTIYAMYQDAGDVEISKLPHHTMVVSYISRNEIPDVVEISSAVDTDELVKGIDNELTRLKLAKDLITVQGKLAQITTLVQQVYADVNDIQEKYNLPTVDDILKSIK